jgi:ABC-2 type transport system ATP-binding protein
VTASCLRGTSADDTLGMKSSDTEPSSAIQVDNVRRTYRSTGSAEFEAVRGVSFVVRRGELFALLGTNGAGKTSILELLEGLSAPASGTVKVLGHDPVRDRQLIRGRTGVVLQEGGLPTGLTVAETARMWGGTLTAARPWREALEMVELGHRAEVAVRQLSGGERRRLDLALAVLGRPEVLFLDEPTAGLDPESRARTWGLIRRLLDTGTTVVLTTHYLAEAEDLADRVAILHRGLIVRTGTPAEVSAGQPARINFSLPAGDVYLPELAGATVEDHLDLGRRHVVVRTAALQQTLAAVLEWAAAHDLTLTDLDARPASLEEAFLAVAAHDPRPTTAGEMSA